MKRTDTVPGGAGLEADEVLGMVSHELRNPLGVIAGLVDVMLRNRAQMTFEERGEVLAQVRTETERLQRLVNSMLLLAHQDADAAVETEPILLQRLLPRLIETVGRHPDDRYEVDLPDSLPAVLGNAGFIEQVLENLLSNASKYGVPGKPVEVAATVVPGGVSVAVTNEGDHVSEEEAARLFEPYFRAAEGRKHAKGVGLGLVVCQRIMQAQGGSIAAQARLGGGLTVTFTLPTA
ncbi:MAG: hypothetical protein IT429_14500 [Gemmataceae bacterium]|nr:hypothetical protein [Gemmataceae bacterium]